ncbi:MAG: DUF6702 family protein [Pseudomonadota bacterium]
MSGGLLLLIAALSTIPGGAHQQRESITRVLFNPNTGNIEIMHRFGLHDAEHAGPELFGRALDLLGAVADRDLFAAYVHDRFALRDQSGAELPLTPVGHEIERQFLWVYAEAPIPDRLTALTMSHGALRDIWAEQTNLVNVERDAVVRTATFNGDRQQITIQF